jgi:hypothetical protein
MPLSPRYRAWLYAAFTLLFLSGAAWLALDQIGGGAAMGPWAGTATWLLMIHGGVAMPALMLLGALFPLHIQPSLRRAKNFGSGFTMLTVIGLLILTAFGLYYAGGESLRAWSSDLHIALGLAFPILLTAHILWGKRDSLRRRLD